MIYYKELRKQLKEEILEVIAHNRDYEYDTIDDTNEQIAAEDNISPNSEEVKYSIRKSQNMYNKEVVIKTLKKLLKNVTEEYNRTYE